MKVIKEKTITVPEALVLLQKRQKEGELGYEQQNTLAYLQAEAKLDEKDAAELVKELKGLGLTDKQSVMLASIIPKKEEEVKLILSYEKTDVSGDKVKEILKLLKKHKPSKD